MIISGGENIHPKEIENALCAQPAILDWAIFGIPDHTRGDGPAPYGRSR
jgi:acyl-CoA synthetase (AMP-forming)/AMP-acid ligase II